MTQSVVSPQARLRRQIRLTLTFGLPLTLAGAATCVAAFWLGMDVQGWVIVICGSVVLLAGFGMLLLAVGTSIIAAEAAVRRRLRRGRKAKANTRRANAASPATGADPPAISARAAEPTERSSGTGPMIF